MGVERMSLVRIDNLAGIPLFYDRFSSNSYGNEAVPMRPYIDSNFGAECEQCFGVIANAFSGAGLGITQIWSGGVGRAGTGASYHHKNRAFDLDALVFQDSSMWIANTFPSRPFIYLALEACLRMHFGTVLNYDYNQAHEDHFHFDNGTSVRFKRDARSHTLFVQHCLTKLFNVNVGPAGVDGVFGPDTDAALKLVRQQIGIGPLSKKENWLKFLSKCQDEALSNEQNMVSSG